MAAAIQHAQATSTHQNTALTNGHADPIDSVPPPAPVAPGNKKGKGKKDKYGPDEMSKALAAKISQLEQDAAGEKDQEAEIGAWSFLHFAGGKESSLANFSSPRRQSVRSKRQLVTSTSYSTISNHSIRSKLSRGSTPSYWRI